MRRILLAFLLAAGIAAAADVNFNQAVEIFMRARQGQEKDVEPAVAAFDALARAEPRNPVYAAYLGSAIALKSRKEALPVSRLYADLFRQM